MRILVTGATGFVGPAVVQRLVDDGHTVRVLEHSEGSSADLPSQEAVSGSMTDAASLREAAEGQDVVVHLVAILTGKPEEFRSVMEQGTRDLLEAARGAGVRRFVLMSALGTTEETKDLVPYYGAKWQMEQDVKASGLEYVIFRPSFVFGRDGGALGQFKKIAKLAPVTPIVGPGTQRIQPIWVEDVAAYFAAGVEKPEAANRTFELGGPDVVTWNEFWSRLKQAQGSRRPSVHLPFGLMRIQAAVLEKLPKPPVTRDQLKMLDGRRQRRFELGRGRHVRPPARPARRAAPPRRRAGLTARTPKGRFRGPSNVGTSLYWQRRFLPKRRVRCDAFRTIIRGPPTLARRFPLQVLGARPYRLTPPLPVLEISTAGPPPFRGYRECSRRPRRTMSAWAGESISRRMRSSSDTQAPPAR